MMLQNELFQREVRQHLGDDFANNFRGQRYSVGGGGQQPRGPPVARRDPRMNGAAAGTTGIGSPNNVVGGENAGDLGIMKSLSSMGSAARRNLVQLAQRFSSGQQSSSQQQLHHRTGEVGTSGEFRPLVDGNDEDEVIYHQPIFFLLKLLEINVLLFQRTRRKLSHLILEVQIVRVMCCKMILALRFNSKKMKRVHRILLFDTTEGLKKYMNSYTFKVSTIATMDMLSNLFTVDK